MLAEEKIIQRIDELLKKDDKAFTTRESNDIPGIMTYKLNVGIFAEWRTQTLNFLISFLGNNHIYAQTKANVLFGNYCFGRFFTCLDYGPAGSVGV